MDWDMFWTMLITGGTSLIVAILGRLMSRNDDPEQVLDPKWAEIVDILTVPTLKWLYFHLQMGMQWGYEPKRDKEQSAFFVLVKRRILKVAAEEQAAIDKIEREKRYALYSKQPETGDYIEESTIAGPTQYIPLDYTEWDAEYGKTLNEKRSA